MTTTIAARRQKIRDATAPVFPDEVLMQILSWLPLKSLLRFKCVSKAWLQGISTDMYFINLHQERVIKPNSKMNADNSGLLILRPSHPHLYYAQSYNACDMSMEIESPLPLQDSFVSGIVNGLVSFCQRYPRQQVYVWNPLTGDHITFPSSPNSSCQVHSKDPLYATYGFGYDRTCHEYKMIRFRQCKWGQCHTNTQLSVYTLGTDNSWRALDDVPFRMDGSTGSFNEKSLRWSSGKDKFAPLLNGALHWLTYNWRTIVSFDLKGEVCREIAVPKSIHEDVIDGYRDREMIVGELGGLLCLSRECIGKVYVEIWVMREYGTDSSWEKLHKIRRGQYGLQPIGGLKPIGVADNGEIIVKRDTKELIMYSPKRKKKQIRHLPKFGFDAADAYAFTGTLVSPTLINGPAHQ